ncbi:MAG: 2-hydroxyacid dehydrogenase [Pyramidobacter sp.]|jgi:glycerate dehydrogenase
MRHQVVFPNAEKMDYDGTLDFSVPGCDVRLCSAESEGDILRFAEGADVLVSKELPLPAKLIEALPPEVQLICEAGTGYNNIALAAADARGIAVCNVPAYSTQRVAHTAVMLMLNLASSMRAQMAMLERGDHRNFTEHLLLPHVELNGKTLGVIGAGHIGSEVIKIALALDMKVLVFSRRRFDRASVSNVPLEELLRRSDFVSLHCPLTAETRHLINDETLALMKKSAFLINTARGALVDEAALIRALKEGKIAGAGLDVQEQEPPEEDNPLYAMENVILTPHMGWKGKETRQRLVSGVAADIVAFFDGAPVNVVKASR